MVFPEHLNDHDRHTVCVTKDDVIVRHVPCEQVKTMWHFLMHESQVSCEVTGRRKLGNGLEVPCTYKLTGREKLVNRMQELLSKQQPDPIYNYYIYINIAKIQIIILTTTPTNHTYTW